MDKIIKTIAFALLGWMFILMFFSSWNDSATMDELAHIPSGYSYLTQHDYRLNPEHPPLMKDLAAFPLLFLNLTSGGLNFPTNVPSWTNAVNGQWDMGRIFLYESGNNPDKILRFARFPIMLLALLFGWMLFNWAKSLYGNKVGLLTLFFYTMSPTIIAHSRYVTTDLGAAFGFFIGMASFINFLKHQTKKNLIIAGVAFGIAQLLKFSLVLLVPVYFILAILWVILENYGDFKKIFAESFRILGKLVLIGIIGLLVIWPVYQFHVFNYPPQKQLYDTQTILQGFKIKPLADFVIWLSDKPVLRAIGQYLFGVLMVVQRANGGNTAYFLGTVTNMGSPFYFPVLYLTKELLAFLILAGIAGGYAIKNIISAKEKNFRVAAEWARDNFALTAAMVLIVVYMGESISSHLNIGIRHIMPLFPFAYLLVARQIVRWSKTHGFEEPQTFFQYVKDFFERFIKSMEKHFLLAALLLWMFFANLLAAPYYLSYYNAFGGGTENGYKIAVDSNYDWGQDLKRLNDFVEKRQIQKIAVDYFGGGSPEYYLGDKFIPWQSKKGAPPKGTWLATSIEFLQTNSAKQIKGFKIKPENTYAWLKGKKPFTRAGTSIFIYKF